MTKPSSVPHPVDVPASVPNAILPPEITIIESPRINRRVWGQYSIDTDFTTITPDTGITRNYNLTLTENTVFSPDGFSRTMQVFNNQFPGPLIEANWGDWISV